MKMYEVLVKEYVTDKTLFDGAQATETGLRHILRRFGNLSALAVEDFVKQLDKHGEHVVIGNPIPIAGCYKIEAMTEQLAVELA